MMTRSGKCQCGAISYSVEGDPTYSALCWCRDCRASAGAPAVVWTLFRRDAVTIAGTPVGYNSSPGSTRQFCGTCGTGLFFLNESIFPGQVDIQAATFDDLDAFPPTAAIQVADAPGWMTGIADMPRFQRYPRMPE